MAKKKKPPAAAAGPAEQPPANRAYNEDDSASLLGEAENGGNEEIEALFDDPTARPDPNARDTDDKNNNAMHKAAANGDTAVMKTLQKHGTKFDAQNDDKDTPLTLAAAGGQEAAVTLLLGWKANPNAADTNGDTALMRGAAIGNINIVADLLANGAGINDRNKKNQTALSMATTYAMGELLLVKGAQPWRQGNPSDLEIANSHIFDSPKRLMNVAADVQYWLSNNQSEIHKAIGESRFKILNSDGDDTLELFEVVRAMHNAPIAVVDVDTSRDFRASKAELIATLKRPELGR